MTTIKLNTYLIEITKPIAYMPRDKYIQTASKGPGNRFYINKGAAGGRSISDKHVKILACGVGFMEN